MKRVFDFCVSFIGLLILLPIFLLISVLVLICSSRPIFFIQKRVGLNGMEFNLYKFRTMEIGADKGGSITTANDARVTKIGRFLRKYKLDELPQLWNVFKGDMSFVGPRPEVPEYIANLNGEQRRILSVKPGITGPATLYFRNEEELLALCKNPKKFNDEVIYPEKIKINLEYIDSQSFLKDVGFIIATVLPGFSQRVGLNKKLGLDYASFNQKMVSLAKEY